MRRRDQMRRGIGAAAIVALAMLWLWPAAAMAQQQLAVSSKVASYDDVRFELQNAIIGSGLVIDFNGQVSSMLDRTGADVGSAKPIYKKAEYFAFCSAKLSRAMMEADPSNAGFCPFVVYIYETVAKPGTTYVGYRRPESRGSNASKAALAEVDKLLAGIVRAAVK